MTMPHAQVVGVPGVGSSPARRTRIEFAAGTTLAYGNGKTGTYGVPQIGLSGWPAIGSPIDARCTRS